MTVEQFDHNILAKIFSQMSLSMESCTHIFLRTYKRKSLEIADWNLIIYVFTRLTLPPDRVQVTRLLIPLCGQEEGESWTWRMFADQASFEYL